MKSLSRSFLIAIGATSVGVTLLSSLAGFFVFRSVLEVRQRRHLAEYLAERHSNLSRRFSALSEVHNQAISELLRQTRGLSADTARRMFDAHYVAQPDGTRRTRDGDFDGRWTPDGDYVRGMGGFLSPRLATPLEERAFAAAFSVVHHFGQGMHSSWDNFYFATPNNKMVMYGPDRPDHLMFYRHSAPATFNFSNGDMMKIAAPALDPDRRTRCTSLQRLLQYPQTKRLATACVTPVYIDGKYVGEFGSSLYMADFLARAVRPLDNFGTSLVVRTEGDVLAFPGVHFDRNDDEELHRVTERFHVRALMRAILASKKTSGVISSPDGRDLVGFGRLDGPDWWLLLVYPKSATAASAAASAAWILALGVVAALAQTVLILAVARRRIVAPLEALAGSCSGDGGASAETQALASRDDELGVLARALNVERENAELVQSSLEARVRARTAELESSAREQARFLAGMSHELRTPLSGVMAASEALAARQCDDEGRRMMELIVKSGRRLERTLADMAEVASLDAGEIALCAEPFDLRALVEHAGSLHRAAAEAKGVGLDVVCAPGAAGVYLGDAERITQILSHYLVNAVKFTDAGWVSLRVERGAGEALRFTVSDTGRGFDEAQRARLFERRTDVDAAEREAGATGLGLAVCRAIARAMGGEVAAASRPGVGSMFTLTVALPPANLAAGSGPRAVADARPLAGARVLLAEPGAANQRIVALILEGAGAQLRVVDEGAQALAALAEEAFDAVLLDAQLPDLDGAAAVRELRAREGAQGRSRTPVIVMATETRRELKAAALRAGADGVVAKPVHAPDLVAAIAGLLAAAAPGARAA